MKRVVIMSDLHCGHRAGITPPGWQYPELDNDDPERQTFARNQRLMWKWFTSHIDELRPIDYLLVNGDCIDGKGFRSGGTEQLEADRSKQADMAKQVIDYVSANKVVMTFGTAYHAGAEEDWERRVAEDVGAEKIGGHEWVDVEGCVFDLKHKIGGSTIPHGRYTAIAREDLWNALWAEQMGQPRAHVLIRSHVHYFAYQGRDGHLGIVTPALQGWGSKYGVRECSGIVDSGLIHFDVENERNYTWAAHLMRPESATDMIVKL